MRGNALPCDQFGRATALTYAPVFKEEERIARLHCAQPVGDHHNGPRASDGFYRVHHRGLGLIVQGARCLVEHDNGRITIERPGDADALSLSAGKLGAALAYLGFVTPGKFRDDEVMDMRLFAARSTAAISICRRPPKAILAATVSSARNISCGT